MTPKEEAKRLVEIFSPLLPFYNENDNKNKAKRCALVSVDEIVKQLELFYPKYESWDLQAKLNYWRQVKEEIQKL